MNNIRSVIIIIVYYAMLILILFIEGSLAIGKAVDDKDGMQVSMPNQFDPTPQGDNLIYSSLPTGIKGIEVNIYEDAKYGDRGYEWPWSNYFIFRKVGNPVADNLKYLDNKQNVITYKVNVKANSFIIQPIFSPDGQNLILKMGDSTSSWASFSLYIYNMTLNKLEKIDTGNNVLSYWQLYWSPNCRYIAYYLGGVQYPSGDALPFELWLYDLDKHSSRLVVKGGNSIESVSWTHENKLLYTSTKINSHPNETVTQDSQKLARLYCLDPTNYNDSIFIYDDTVRQEESPDGNWIVAFSRKKEVNFSEFKRNRVANKSGEDAYKWSQNRFLTLYPQHGRDPIIVRSVSNEECLKSIIIWAPDSQHFYRITKRYIGKGKVRATIYEFNLEIHTEIEISTINYEDKYGNEADGEDPLLNPLSISHDNRYLLFSLNQISEYQPQKGLEYSDTYLKALDLITHEFITISRVKNLGGVDWYDLSK